MAANAAQSAAGARPAAEPQSASAGTPVDESKCQWSAPKTDVKQGEQATIAGSNAQRVTIAVTTTCSDPGSNTSCDFVFSLDEWLAPEMPGAAETRAFWRAYAQKLNLGDELSASMQANAQQVFDRYKSGWGEAMKQAGLQKGYPVKSIMSMQYGGPQCKDNSTSNANASNTADTSSASSPPTSIGDAASSLASGLFNRMRKKPDESQSSTPGMVQLFQMSSETVAVRTDSIPKQAFEVPADYSLVAGAGVP